MATKELQRKLDNWEARWWELQEDDCGFCRHGYPEHDCAECEAEIEADGGIEKCLNCGRYKSGNQLNEHQVCKHGCRNPNEC